MPRSVQGRREVYMGSYAIFSREKGMPRRSSTPRMQTSHVDTCESPWKRKRWSTLKLQVETAAFSIGANSKMHFENKVKFLPV